MVTFVLTERLEASFLNDVVIRIDGYDYDISEVIIEDGKTILCPTKTLYQEGA